MTSYNTYKFSQNPVGKVDNRWADEEEIRGNLHHICISDPESDSVAGGIPVISNGNDVWVDSGDTHSLIIGSTGSKKTRLFVMPALKIFQTAGESVVVTDPKGELYGLTADDFRASGYDVKVLNLRDPSHSDCWNPLKLAREYYHAGNIDKAAEVVSDFAYCMIPDNATSNKDPFWDNTSRAMIRGLCMMMVENEEYFPDQDVNVSMLRSLSEGMNVETDSFSEVGPVYQFLLRHYPENSMARVNLQSVVRGSEKTFGNICVSYDAAMSPLYIQQSLIELLSCNTVDFRLMGKRPSILYLVVPDEKKTLNKVVSLCVAQLYQQLIEVAQNSKGNKLPVRVNFLLDEFSNFPAIPDFDAMISAGRSRNIRFHLVVQGLEQMKSRYGAEISQTIKANCENWFFLTSRELDLLNEISNLCGMSRNGEALISPVQLQRLRKERGECLVLMGRNYPYIAHLPDISNYEGYSEDHQSSSYPKRDVSLFHFRSYQDVLSSEEDEDEDDGKSQFSSVWDDLL